MAIKRILVLLMWCAMALGAVAQPVGKWEGELSAGAAKLPLAVRIAGAHKAWLDSPAQMAMNIECDSLLVTDTEITVGVSKMGLLISGKVNAADRSFNGTLRQGFASLPLTMKYVSSNPYLERPQTPQPPYPYQCREVEFGHDGITLGGTLTMPEGGSNLTAVVLVSGSGQQNRDEEIMGHRPFMVIADCLTRAGIAVLRYDDRGVGASSALTDDATTADFAKDALAAVRYLRSLPGINKDKVGIIGHSEGGMIANMLVAENPDEVHFAVALAAPTVQGKQLLLQQMKDLAMSSGEALNAGQTAKMEAALDAIDTESDAAAMKKRVREALGNNAMIPENVIAAQVNAMTNPWYVHFVRYNPLKHLSAVSRPVLALYGSNDLQVNAAANAAVYSTLKNAKYFTVSTCQGVNHMFQQCSKPTVDYGAISQTISPTVLADIVKWLQALSPLPSQQ